MTRKLIPLLILLTLASAAHAIGLGEGNRFGRLGAFKKNGASAPAATGFILMVDNTSRILQTDNTSKICRAGGC